MKNKKGSITIEASIVIFLFMIFILIFLGFGKYYKAQNAMKHSLNQTAQTLSIESAWRNELNEFEVFKVENELSDILNDVMNFIGGHEFDFREIENTKKLDYKMSYNMLKRIVRKELVYYLTGLKTNKEDDQNKALKQMGITSLEFNDLKINKGGNIKIEVEYKVHTDISYNFGSSKNDIGDVKLNDAVKIKLQ